MRFEGTLDAFSLPDILQLLSSTKKTGTLHLRHGGGHGVVHLRHGAVTGGRSDAGRQALARRLVGSGLVDDSTLAAAAEVLTETPGAGLGRVLVDTGALDRDAAAGVAAEQATDAVFDLMRWPDGEFAFVVDEPDPDDLGTSIPVDDVVAEGRRRLEVWAGLNASVPAPDAVVSFAPARLEPPVLATAEWALVSVVDGRHTVADLVALSGRGDFAIVGALSALLERGLLKVRTPADGDGGTSALLGREALLAALEGRLPAVPAASRVPEVPAVQADDADQAATAGSSSAPDGPGSTDGAGRDTTGADVAAVDGASAGERSPAIPARPEPFRPLRRPDHPQPVSVRTGTTVGAVHGATALAPDAALAPMAPPLVERDPAIDKNLLLRLIAGVGRL